MTSNISKILKRSGDIVDFDRSKIVSAILNAMNSSGDNSSEELAEKISLQVMDKISEKFHHKTIPAVEEVQDVVEEALIENKLIKTAKAYILYRDKRRQIREIKSSNEEEIMENYLGRADWRLKENSNMSFSVQGLNNYIASSISAKYWLNKLYPDNIREAHIQGDFHIHDLGLLAPYCCGWDLKDLLLRGFGGVNVKIQSKPPKHFRSALGQVVNFFYTMQGEAAGAQAFSNFDTYLAPFIRYDDLSYKDVKQAIQEFVFNVNVPCYSEDTEVLCKDGWKYFKDVTREDLIATRSKDKKIEYHNPKEIISHPYNGKLVNVKTSRLDLLVTPNHNMLVSRQGSKGRYEDIIPVLQMKYNDRIPKTANWEGEEQKYFILNEYIRDEQFYSGLRKKYYNRKIKIKAKKIKMDDWLAFLGIWLAEGYAVNSDSVSVGSGNYRVGIVNKAYKKEIRRLLKKLPFHFGETKDRFIIHDKQLWLYLSKLGDCYTKHIPEEYKSLSKRQLIILFNWFGLGDGSIKKGRELDFDYGYRCFSTVSKKLRDDIVELIIKIGKAPRVRKDLNKGSKIGNREIKSTTFRYSIYVNISNSYSFYNKKHIGPGDKLKFPTVDYNKNVYCVEVPNGVVMVRRNGTYSWCGNTRVGFQTPFTNITLDVTPSKAMKEEGVIIGGKIMDETYGDFQTEIDLFNKAFAEVMIEGDASGRVFSFPIPTYNIDKEFDWDRESLKPMWEMTSKYGLPYFSNFVNSDMDRDDARSMCCRLRLDNRELRKRGGGLFGANPLTGSLGVVTINLARLGYLSEDEEDFKNRLADLMDLARSSLEIKRKVIEKFTEDGLYPYSKYYLNSIKEQFDSYWKNHFNTIGLNGMNEASLNLLGENIASARGYKLALSVMDFMREKIATFQEETGDLYNLEATPAEGCTYRFAKKDKETYPNIICANDELVKKEGANPYYTNSTHLPVDFTEDLFTALDLQDELQTKYTGGTVLHGFLGERINDPELTKKLVKNIVNNYSLPYFTLTPTFSVCPIHGYLSGEHKYCPKCDEEKSEAFFPHGRG